MDKHFLALLNGKIGGQGGMIGGLGGMMGRPTPQHLNRIESDEPRIVAEIDNNENTFEDI